MSHSTWQWIDKLSGRTGRIRRAMPMPNWRLGGGVHGSLKHYDTEALRKSSVSVCELFAVISTQGQKAGLGQFGPLIFSLYL